MDIEIIETTVIQGKLSKPSVSFSPNGENKYEAIVTFTVTNENSTLEGSTILTVHISTEEWNAFWLGFNNGRFLLEKLQEKYNLSNLQIPENIEDWYVN